MPGILAIFNDLAPGREVEFEEWFQHAERLAIPGFLIARRHEAISGRPRYFHFYVAQSVEIFRSAAYLGRLDAPASMTRVVMSEIFRGVIRTVCHRTFRLGIIAACLMIETLRVPDAEKIAATLGSEFQNAEFGVYRLS